MQPDVYGKIYHVLNPNNSILFADIINCMCRCAIPLESVSLEKWHNKLMTLNDRDTLIGSIGEFLHENSFEETNRISAEQYCTSISSWNLPSFNNMYLMKWLSFISDNIVHQKCTNNNI
ncbi:unnamed protein product [Adineta steineri]|nr:unnamed protein product [Adineta steineri]